MLANPMTDPIERFATELAGWVDAHAIRHSTTSSAASVLHALENRLPAEIRELVGVGLDEGYLGTTRGYWVGPPTDEKQAQYMLTVTSAPARASSPCWEVFVQLAEYVRLRGALGATGLTLQLEDRLMDITVSDGEILVAYVELKVAANTARSLVDGVRTYGEEGVDLAKHDRRDDALKKAQYIARHRPSYFAVRAIDHATAFEVVYGEGNRFELRNPNNHFGIEAYLSSRRSVTPPTARNPVGELAVAMREACPELSVSTGTGQSAYNFYLEHAGQDRILLGVYDDGLLWSNLVSLTPTERERLSVRLAAIGVSIDTQKEWAFWRVAGTRANLGVLDVERIAVSLASFIADLV